MPQSTRDWGCDDDDEARRAPGHAPAADRAVPRQRHGRDGVDQAQPHEHVDLLPVAAQVPGRGPGDLRAPRAQGRRVDRAEPRPSRHRPPTIAPPSASASTARASRCPQARRRPTSPRCSGRWRRRNRSPFSAPSASAEGRASRFLKQIARHASGMAKAVGRPMARKCRAGL